MNSCRSRLKKYISHIYPIQKLNNQVKTVQKILLAKTSYAYISNLYVKKKDLDTIQFIVQNTERTRLFKIPENGENLE